MPTARATCVHMSRLLQSCELPHQRHQFDTAATTFETVQASPTAARPNTATNATLFLMMRSHWLMIKKKSERRYKPLHYYERVSVWYLEGVCVVQESCRLGAARRTPQDYNRLFGSDRAVRPKLTDRAIRYIVRQMKKGRRTKDVAEETGVTQRHVQRLWAEYRRTGTLPALGSAGRPRGSGPSDEEVQAVLDAHRRRPEEVLRTTRRLIQDGYHIRYNRVYAILKSNGLVTALSASPGGESG